MTSVDRNLSDAHCRTTADLAFLVNGTLAPDDAARAREHLQECADCRRDLALETALMARVREEAVLDYAPHAAFAKLAVRIDEHEARRARHAWWLPGARVRLRLRDAVIFTQAVAIAVLVLLIANAGWRAREPSAAAPYRTLTQTRPLPRTDAPLLKVVFDEGVRSAELRRMLGAIDGAIVDGPSPGGVFTIALDSAAGVPATPAVAAEWLRTQPGVRFAEVVQPAPMGR